jgi:hypothetical protein
MKDGLLATSNEQIAFCFNALSEYLYSAVYIPSLLNVGGGGWSHNETAPAASIYNTGLSITLQIQAHNRHELQS